MTALPRSDWPAVWYFHNPTPRFEPDGSAGESDPPDRARWVLALGIFSLVVGPLGLFAWMAGNSCLHAIAEGRLDPVCESNARAGRLLGFIAMIMFAFKATVLAPLATWYWLL